MDIIGNILAIIGYVIAALFIITYILMVNQQELDDMAKKLCLFVITWSFLTSTYLLFGSWHIIR